MERFELFDAEFYLAQYREVCGDFDNPLDHFCQVGLHQGLLPNRDFDPLLYLLRYPECQSDPIRHFAESDCTNRLFQSYNEAFPDIATNVTGAQLRFCGRRDFDRDEDWQLSRKASQEMCRPVLSSFEAAGNHFQFLSPAPEFVLQRLIDDAPMALARLPHIFWDTICATQNMIDLVQADCRCKVFSSEQSILIARRFTYEMLPEKSGLAENFHPELCQSLARFRNDKRLNVSVAFKGYPTWDNRLFNNVRTPGEVQQKRLDVFACHFDNIEPIVDAMLWKNWVISGAVRDLPTLARHHPVVLIGPQRVHEIGDRWQLPHVQIVPIPDRGAHELRYELLDQCRVEIQNAIRLGQQNQLKRPIFFSQCGGTLATWLFARLLHEFPDIFYFDLGQALDAWFLDKLNVHRGWVDLYAGSIIENGQLQDYYRDLLGSEYERFYESFASEET